MFKTIKKLIAGATLAGWNVSPAVKPNFVKVNSTIRGQSHKDYRKAQRKNRKKPKHMRARG